MAATLEIDAALNRFAESDMRLARKCGEIGVTQTKVGFVMLSYNKATREYEIRKGGMTISGNTQVVMGAAKVVKPVLMELYDVEVEIEGTGNTLAGVEITR